MLDDRYVHGRAMVDSMRSVFDVSLPDDVVVAIEPWGKTDLRIARDVLRRAGLSDTAITSGLSTWAADAERRFRERATAECGAWEVRPGLAECFDVLARGGVHIAPLTGNLKGIAQAKLELMGLHRFFDFAGGAFGDDAEDRRQLPGIARARCGDWPRRRTWIVGDAPADVDAASADGVRCVLFSSSRLEDTVAAKATAVVACAADLPAVILSSSE